VNNVYDAFGATFDLYSYYGRKSIDNHNMALIGTVHYSQQYDNAFWNGQQMVFGDGDGVIFGDFTKPIDVIGHELTHGVTQHTAGLNYQDQPGALNESFSDVFGTLVKQHFLNQDVNSADWLIGAGLLAPGVNGVALRSMKAPGTAYDDPNLGKDPQPATMSSYVQTWQDNGGVHINSGIPNHAFYLAAMGIGGFAWEKAGKIWYVALTQYMRPDTNFAGCANATLAAAGNLFGAGSMEYNSVQSAWTQVGV
jgi:Zn-dependent metalloprotease